MVLCAYSLVVSTVFALLYAKSPQAANELVMFFVVAVLIPAVTQDWRNHRRRRPR